jgi:DNA-binding NarL/FixJ family response regulator
VVRSAFTRGAVAFIRKDVDPRDLPSAVRQAVNGTVAQPIFGDTGGAELAPADDPGLSERERAILSALGEGMSNKQIARQLWLAEQTVKFHLTNIYRKLGRLHSDGGGERGLSPRSARGAVARRGSG